MAREGGGWPLGLFVLTHPLTKPVWRGCKAAFRILSFILETRRGHFIKETVPDPVLGTWHHEQRCGEPRVVRRGCWWWCFGSETMNVRAF